VSGADAGWGPWIEHDGKGCPCHPECTTDVWLRRECTPKFCPRPAREWDWPWGGDVGGDVIHYRILKPRGMTILEGLLENLPERVDA
jgi:hypothetical protein